MRRFLGVWFRLVRLRMMGYITGASSILFISAPKARLHTSLGLRPRLPARPCSAPPRLQHERSFPVALAHLCVPRATLISQGSQRGLRMSACRGMADHVHLAACRTFLASAPEVLWRSFSGHSRIDFDGFRSTFESALRQKAVRRAARLHGVCAATLRHRGAIACAPRPAAVQPHNASHA